MDESTKRALELMARDIAYGRGQVMCLTRGCPAARAARGQRHARLANPRIRSAIRATHRWIRLGGSGDICGGRYHWCDRSRRFAWDAADRSTCRLSARFRNSRYSRTCAFHSSALRRRSISSATATAICWSDSASSIYAAFAASGTAAAGGTRSGCAAANSGQMRCQSSGRRSMRVTAPSVARSISTQRSIGTVRFPDLHSETVVGVTASRRDSADAPPASRHASSMATVLMSASLGITESQVKALPLGIAIRRNAPMPITSLELAQKLREQMEAKKIGFQITSTNGLQYLWNAVATYHP